MGVKDIITIIIEYIIAKYLRLILSNNFRIWFWI